MSVIVVFLRPLGLRLFTLIELMVVIVIIGVLAALAIPKFSEASSKAKAAEPPTVLASYDHAQLAYLSETGRLGTYDSLVFDTINGNASKWFNYSSPAKGSYAASPIAAFGKVTTSDSVATAVSSAGVVTHRATGGFAIYLPNWK